jgi:hypothetical protein
MPPSHLARASGESCLVNDGHGDDRLTEGNLCAHQAAAGILSAGMGGKEVHTTNSSLAAALRPVETQERASTSFTYADLARVALLLGLKGLRRARAPYCQ